MEETSCAEGAISAVGWGSMEGDKNGSSISFTFIYNKHCPLFISVYQKKSEQFYFYISNFEHVRNPDVENQEHPFGGFLFFLMLRFDMYSLTTGIFCKFAQPRCGIVLRTTSDARGNFSLWGSMITLTDRALKARVKQIDGLG